jgi:hypothetical protein
VYDALGRAIENIVDKELKPGTYEVSWNAAKFGSGIYFARIISGKNIETLKMLLIK